MFMNSGVNQYEVDIDESPMLSSETQAPFSAAILRKWLLPSWFRIAAGAAAITSNWRLEDRKTEWQGSPYKLKQLLFNSLEAPTIPLTSPSRM